MADQNAAPAAWLLRIDRRVVYLLLLVALAAPLIGQKFTGGLVMRPAPLPSARMLFDRIEKIARERDEAVRPFATKRRPELQAMFAAGEEELKKLADPAERKGALAAAAEIGKLVDPAERQKALDAAVDRALEDEIRAAGLWNRIVIIGSEVEPQTRGELYPQAEAVYRHLMMRRLRFAVMTLTPAGVGYCRSIPDKVARELGREYGRDWANFGYQIGGGLRLQQMGKNIPGTLKADVNGAAAEKIPCMAGVKDAADVALVVEISGLVGTLGSWINYFASEKARPDMADGCTAVSVTDSFAYLESKQIVGLLEGIAGAAAYNEFLKEIRQPGQPHPSAGPSRHMTSQTVAHVLIIVFVVLGNTGILFSRLAARRKGAKR